VKGSKLNSDESSSDSDSSSDVSSDGSDAVVVTLYSVVSSDDLYSVVIAYSDYSSNNHPDSLYSVVVKSLYELCVEFLYSVVV